MSPPTSVTFTGTGQTRIRDLRTMTDFAEAIGAKPDTIHAYKSRGYLPEPAGVIGTTPVWTAAQVSAWVRNRAGQGKRPARVGASN